MITFGKPEPYAPDPCPTCEAMTCVRDEGRLLCMTCGHGRRVAPRRAPPAPKRTTHEVPTDADRAIVLARAAFREVKP